MPTKIFLALFCGLSLACRDAAVDRDRPLSEVWDSAGVRIVENRRPPETSRLGWRVGPEPSASIGALEGEEPYLLHWATATMLPDGRIAVANAGSNEVRLFDRSGGHLATWGGQGEGPGEFSFLSHVAPWSGDSLVAWYSQGLSISVFDAAGNFGRSFSLRCTQAESWLRPAPVAARPDGTILSLNAPEAADTAVVEIWDGGGALSASLGAHPNWIVFIETDEYGNRELSRPAYGPELRVAPWGDLVAVGHTSRYEIKAFRGDGSLVRVVRRDDALRVPVPGDLEPFVESQMSRFAESTYPVELLPDLRRALESGPLAETFPAFRRSWLTLRETSGSRNTTTHGRRGPRGCGPCSTLKGGCWALSRHPGASGSWRSATIIFCARLVMTSVWSISSCGRWTARPPGVRGLGRNGCRAFRGGQRARC